jgi:hypothetical protein
MVYGQLGQVGANLRWASNQMSPSCRWSMLNDCARLRAGGSRSRFRENRFDRKFFFPAMPPMPPRPITYSKDKIRLIRYDQNYIFRPLMDIG